MFLRRVGIERYIVRLMTEHYLYEYAIIVTYVAETHLRKNG
jgi:hypothetical protein